MIRFSLFGVPVSIHPTLWLTLAILGRAFLIVSLVDVVCVLLFIIAAFLVLLAHEMGHALVGRYLGGGQPSVYLAWLGGDCTNETARLTRLQGVVMTAAGPLSSLAVGGLAYVVLSLYVGGPKKRTEQEQNYINNAKWLLMERNNMTEQEAFRYIQKCSMDSGTNMVESAQMILMMICDM